MFSACSSPVANAHKKPLGSPSNQGYNSILLRSKSPKNLSESKSSQLLAVLPTTVPGRVKLFKDLASPQHKHSNSQYSFRHLSNSIADIKNLASMRETTESASPSPKVGKSVRTEENAPVRELRVQIESPKAGLAERRGLSPMTTDTLAFRNEVRKDYEGSPMVRVDEEAYYYDTIKHLDECGKCWTNCQKHHSSPFKLKYKDPKGTSYQRDYVPHANQEKSPLITGDNYETYHSGYTVSHGTTMKEDFKPWASNYVKHEGIKPTLGPENATFFGRTSYGSDFLKFGAPKVPVERQLQHKSTLAELPFGATSSYRENFGDSQEPRKFVTRWPKRNEKSPLPTGIPFLGQTTTSTTYKPYKVGPGQGKEKSNEEFQSTKSFMNQFQTTYAKDFEGKGEAPCPARVFMDNTAHPSMKYSKA